MFENTATSVSAANAASAIPHMISFWVRSSALAVITAIFLTFRSSFHAFIKSPFPQPLNPCSAVNSAADGEGFLTHSATEYAGNKLSYKL